MAKKNNQKLKNFIDLYNGNRRNFCIRRIDNNGKYPMGAPKPAERIIPFIDGGKYKCITTRAKKSLLEFPSSSKVTRRIKKLEEIELSKLINRQN